MNTTNLQKAPEYLIRPHIHTIIIGNSIISGILILSSLYAFISENPEGTFAIIMLIYTLFLWVMYIRNRNWEARSESFLDNWKEDAISLVYMKRVYPWLLFFYMILPFWWGVKSYREARVQDAEQIPAPPEPDHPIVYRFLFFCITVYPKWREEYPGAIPEKKFVKSQLYVCEKLYTLFVVGDTAIFRLRLEDWEKRLDKCDWDVHTMGKDITRKLIRLGKNIGEKDACRIILGRKTHGGAPRELKTIHLVLLNQITGCRPDNLTNKDEERLGVSAMSALWRQWAEEKGYIEKAHAA